MNDAGFARRLEMLEETVESLKRLPDRVGALEVSVDSLASQVLQLRSEMRDGFSAIEGRMATKDDLTWMATKDDLTRMATKDDLTWMATKDDLTRMATKDDLARMATKDDLTRMATKDDLTRMATKDDLTRMATRDDLMRMATKDDLAAMAARYNLERMATKDDLAQLGGELREEMSSAVREMAGFVLATERRLLERIPVLVEDVLSRIAIRNEGTPGTP